MPPKNPASAKAKRKKKTSIKLIVHHDYFWQISPKLQKAWKQSIYRMKKNPRKILVIIPFGAKFSELKAALEGEKTNNGLPEIISYGLKHLGRKRVIVMNFSVFGRIKDYPLTHRGPRDFFSGPRNRLRKIIESRGFEINKIDKITASGIYLSECVASNAQGAAGILGVPVNKIKYLKNESLERGESK